MSISESDDIIDWLLSNGFSQLSQEEKFGMKTRRPTPNLLLEQKDGNMVRRFQKQWYTKYPWLSGSIRRNKLYCFPCTMFDGETQWSRDGIMAVKNFERKAVKHQTSQKHIKNQESLHMLGKIRIEHALCENFRMEAILHNDKVAVNRRVLGRLVQAICYLGKQELPFLHESNSQSINKGNYLELLDLLSQDEQILREHLQSNSAFKCTSSGIQIDLIECITSVLNDTIMQEVDRATFVSVQVDETTDVSCRAKMSIILRYAIGNRIEERFMGFFDVSKDKSALGLAKVILDSLKLWKVEEKLVCQTYDGALVCAGDGSGVPAIIKQSFPHTLFIHSHTHQLNLVLMHGSRHIRQVKFFISDLTVFHTFFSRSSKRSDFLRDLGFHIPHLGKKKWNYYSKAAMTIKMNFQELKRAANYVIEGEDWDPVSVNQAHVLDQKLDDPTFVYLICLFGKIFLFTKLLSRIFETKCVSDVKLCSNEAKHLLDQLRGMRTKETVDTCCEEGRQLNATIDYDNRSFESLRDLTYEILDCVIVQLELRFRDFENLDFVELMNEKKFVYYNADFPLSKFLKLIKQYPFFKEDQLKSELILIYSDTRKHVPPHELLSFIFTNDLQGIYGELTRFIHLVLCLPCTAASRICSTSALKRVKNFLRNSMSNSRLSCISSLAIEKKLLSELSRDPTFKERVVDIFAEKNKHQIELTYKRI